MKLIIDRFENHDAICESETGNFVRLPVDALPKDAREGSIILSENGVFILDRNLENKRRKDMEGRLSSLLKKG